MLDVDVERFVITEKTLVTNDFDSALVIVYIGETEIDGCVSVRRRPINKLVLQTEILGEL
jgi:hypothetical protein